MTGPARRASLAAGAGAAAFLFLVCIWTAAARADVAQVTVVSPGGQSRTLALAAMAGSEDVVGRAYAVRSAGGESARTVTGFSIGALLEAADADPYGFSYLEVQRPAGGSVLLSREQALDDNAFPDGPPVLYAMASDTGFLRPSTGEGDANAADGFEAPQGISIVLRKGSPLRVRVRASPLRTRPGEPVRFEAVVDRAGSGEALSYSWYLDDGHSAAGPTARHSFARRGSFDVVLGVTSGGDEAGTSAVVTIQVGAPIEGPDRKGGGRDRDADAPDHGAATGGSGEGRAASAAGPVVEAAGTRRTEARAPAGELVSGEVLSTAAEGQPSPSSQAPAAARHGQLDGGGEKGGLPTAAWGGLATLALLGLGAICEAGVLGRAVAARRPLGDKPQPHLRDGGAA